jgi:hypothetical protein
MLQIEKRLRKLEAHRRTVEAAGSPEIVNLKADCLRRISDALYRLWVDQRIAAGPSS